MKPNMGENRLNKIFYFRCVNVYVCVCVCSVLLKWYFHFIVVDFCYHSFDIKPNIFVFAGCWMVVIAFNISTLEQKKENQIFSLFSHNMKNVDGSDDTHTHNFWHTQHADEICEWHPLMFSIKRDQFYDTSKYHRNGKFRLNESECIPAQSNIWINK